MAWSNSKTFTTLWTDLANNTTAIDCNSDTFKIALYDNTPTPDNTATSANSAYDAGQWVTANEQYDSTNWDQAGEPLTSVTSTFSSTTYTFDAADTSQGGATCTLSGVYGGLVYDDTIATPVADQGIAYLYFGGSQSVTAGTFTVQYNASGIVSLSVA